MFRKTIHEQQLGTRRGERKRKSIGLNLIGLVFSILLVVWIVLLRLISKKSVSGLLRRSAMNSTSAIFGADVGPIGVGFGTAGLGGQTVFAVKTALEAGFRAFDTAEADWWYDQTAVGQALRDFSTTSCLDDDTCEVTANCQQLGLKISTKIPPWSLTSSTHIRHQASASRETLLGFCSPISAATDEAIRNPFKVSDSNPQDGPNTLYPLDVYYIHAPECWQGWHPRCEGVGPDDILPLRDAWRAMEAVVGIDRSAARIGLSNVSPDQLIDIIEFVKERLESPQPHYPLPRKPDVIQAFADPISPAIELRKLCQDHGIEFVSYSTLGTQHVMKKPGHNPVLNNPKLVEMVSSSYSGRTTAELVLSWALQGGMSVIPRSSKRLHIQQLARLIQSPIELRDNEVAQINSLSQ